jgi:DNA-binding response OmpR family regulator
MADLKSHKILIVDDDKFLLDMYSIKFTEQGFGVDTALGSEVALEKIDNSLRPDIFLVDLLMPKIDGFQLIEKLRERGISRESVIIILSNLGQKEDIDRGLNLGVDGYIIKAATTPSEVVAKVIDISKKKHYV